MKRWLTTSNVLATIAMLCALAGTSITAAWAAPLLTGANVRNSTLTGADLKDLSLSSTDFSSTASTQLKAQTGPAGDKGATGPVGAKGSQGRKGPQGVDAAKAYSYVTADDTTSFVSPKTNSMLNPPPIAGKDCNDAGSLPSWLGFSVDCTPYAPEYPHWRYDCDSIPDYCGSSKVIGSAGAGATRLQTGAAGVVSFTGDENGSFVSLMGPGNLLVTASLTLMHPEVDEWHSRVSCQAQARRSNTSDAYTNLGVPTVVSAQEADELVTITVIGGARFETPGDYDFQVACQMLDEWSTGSLSDNWFFISGNATATTTEL